jgi:flagellar biosynthesis/type III secretory pathway M-ring protein FliF/YscJ
LARVLGPAAGIDAARGDTIEVALVPAIATDSGELVTEPIAATTAATAKSATPTSLLAAAAGGGVLLTLLIVGAMSAKRRKKDRALRGADGSQTGSGSSGKKSKKGKKGEPEPSELLPRIVTGSRSSNDPDREAVDEIKGDLERMLAESPDSLSALLSNWMAK